MKPRRRCLIGSDYAEERAHRLVEQPSADRTKGESERVFRVRPKRTRRTGGAASPKGRGVTGSLTFKSLQRRTDGRHWNRTETPKCAWPRGEKTTMPHLL